jgi:hypothetical protein
LVPLSWLCNYETVDVVDYSARLDKGNTDVVSKKKIAQERACKGEKNYEEKRRCEIWVACGALTKWKRFLEGVITIPNQYASAMKLSVTQTKY